MTNQQLYAFVLCERLTISTSPIKLSVQQQYKSNSNKLFQRNQWSFNETLLHRKLLQEFSWKLHPTQKINTLSYMVKELRDKIGRCCHITWFALFTNLDVWSTYFIVKWQIFWALYLLANFKCFLRNLLHFIF